MNHGSLLHQRRLQVAEEYLLIVAISASTWYFNNYFFWEGLAFGFTLHLVVLHLGSILRYKRYVPGVFTAVIFLAPSIAVLIAAAHALPFDWRVCSLSALAGTIIAAVNLKLMHHAMPVFDHWLDQFSIES